MENVDEVDRLRRIHSLITTEGPGRKYNVEVLHKSGIVLLVACWEAFIEDCVAGALEHMIISCSKPSAMPKDVL
ncbi:MAG: HEPN domain-containing protein, partial [Solimonas sp.]